MSKERLYLYDTTLRDGQQTQGVQFSVGEKIQIARACGIAIVKAWFDAMYARRG